MSEEIKTFQGLYPGRFTVTTALDYFYSGVFECFSIIRDVNVRKVRETMGSSKRSSDVEEYA
jgi:hypothetical protein